MNEENETLLMFINASAPLGFFVEGGGASSAKVSFSPRARSSCLYAATLSRTFLCEIITSSNQPIPSASTTPINIFARRFTLILRRRNCRSRSPLRSQKKISLFLADRRADFFHHRQHVFPDPALFAQRLVPQQIRRVIRRHQRNVAVTPPLPAQFGDANRLAQQPLNRRRPQGHEHLRLDQVNLLVQ